MKNRALWILLAAVLAKSLLFMFMVPPWLGNDEPNHFAYVYVLSGRADQPAAEARILASLAHNDYWRLADMPAPPEGAAAFAQTSLMRHSEDFIGTRSPLYYWIASLPVRLFAPATAEGALHWARGMSALLSLATVFLVWRSAALLFGGGAAALLAGVIAGFHPQFSYLSAMVNSDVLAVLLFSAVFYCCLAMIAAREISGGRLAALFVLLGIALLVKRHAVILFPLAFAAVLMAARSARAAAKGGALFIVVAAAALLSLELAATDSMIRLADRVGLSLGYSFAGPAELAALPAGMWLRGLAIMFVTGWFTVGQMVYKQSFGFYALYALLSGAVFAGVAAGLLRWRREPAARMLAFALLFCLLVLAMNIGTFFSPRFLPLVSGRYLFYAVAPASILAAYGGIRFLELVKRSAWRPALVYLFLALNLIALFGYVGPIYHG
ncbi:MAG: glycosyltransferase family 39 protein [Nitrospinae bacterium]|nr:glycosyltransferase family 39 protein [Nitrospinota bacterium]